MIFLVMAERNKHDALKRINSGQKAQADALEREICATFARGNVSLQQGRYITKSNMDDIQAELVGYFKKDRCK